MKIVKWYEKKWFVNLKIRPRLNISFLLIAAISTCIGLVGLLYILSGDSSNSVTVCAILAALSILNIVFAVGLSNINAFLIVDPLLKNERVLDVYSVGDFNAKRFIRDRDRVTINYKDELGDFTRKLQNLLKYLKRIESCVKLLSEGDLTVDVPVSDDSDQIGNRLSELVENYHKLVSTIDSSIDQIKSGATLISDSSLGLSQGATEQASSIQELTASLEQIKSQTNRNAQNAEKANELVKSITSNAQDGNTEMKQMLKAMDDINASSTNISKIIKVIDDIAFQTNILALNAAVEAARAGEHGKGFAVVAEEVRTLAGRSADAARETTELIESSVRNVEAGTQIANQTAQALDVIVTQVDSASELISHITADSIEQANGVDEINVGISQVSQVVQKNAATAEENAAASEELSSQAVQLKEQASAFKLKKKNVVHQELEPQKA